MHYYLYQVTNKLNGKIYVGVHKTRNLDDGYMGSGKVIRRAIEKYGPENFTKEVLQTFDSADEMFAAEREIVTEEFLARNDVYNLRRGGSGGFDYINKEGLTNAKSYDTIRKGGRSLANRIANDAEFAIKIGKIRSDSAKAQYKNGRVSVFKNPVLQKENSKKAWTNNAREKRTQTHSEIKHQQGEKNSQYGTCWVWHEYIGNKKIRKDLLPEYLDQGWFKKYLPGYKVPY